MTANEAVTEPHRFTPEARATRERIVATITTVARFLDELCRIRHLLPVPAGHSA